MRKVKRIFYGFSYDEGMDMSKKVLDIWYMVSY